MILKTGLFASLSVIKLLVQEKSQQYVQNLYRCATKSIVFDSRLSD